MDMISHVFTLSVITVDFSMSDGFIWLERILGTGVSLSISLYHTTSHACIHGALHPCITA